jgi:hypothetical protein
LGTYENLIAGKLRIQTTGFHILGKRPSMSLEGEGQLRNTHEKNPGTLSFRGKINSFEPIK